MAADSNWRNMRLHQLPWLEVGRQRWPGLVRRNNLLINNCRICRIFMAQNINLSLRHLTILRSHWHIPSFSPRLRPALDIILKTLLNHNGNHSKHSATLNMKRFGREGRRAAAQARRGSRWGQGGASGRITASCLQIRDSLNIYFRYKEERAARGTS